jgi:hypothetical protein
MQHPHRVRNDANNKSSTLKGQPKSRAAKLAWSEPSRSRSSVPLPGDLYSVGGTRGMPFEKVGFVSGFVTDDLAAASFNE